MSEKTYETIQAISHVKIARYLVSKADTKGLTHGEKHHLLEVALGEMIDALKAMGADISNSFQLNNDAHPDTVADDLPF